MSAHPSAPADPPRPKAVLFCPACGHESPVPPDGDWRVREETRDDRPSPVAVYGCPDCGADVVRRPSYGERGRTAPRPTCD